MLSYVGGRRLQKLLSVLGQILGFKITIEDVYINIERLLDELDSKILTYTIVGMNIRNFRPRSGISGQFSASVEDQHIALDLISTYKTDVTNIILQLLVSDETTSIWRVSSVGKIVVRTEEDLIEEQMELIKDIVLRCQDA